MFPGGLATTASQPPFFQLQMHRGEGLDGRLQAGSLAESTTGGKSQGILSGAPPGAAELLTWDVLCWTLCRLDRCCGEKESISLNWEELSIKPLLSVF